MTRPTIRCAIYTRKSSEEGLDQGFNSLDAQHEACAAYVASQRQEGWVLAKDRFDDGGLSGGSLDRPALQRLLAEIDAGRIGMVVVYKIDRLTRSLADFAKLVERLDATNCSFVSVTQAFNTASSMGRLTLNVLLSFAQFEREVTAERIRDKIAASKKKGMWMGGIPPLGYDPHSDPKIRELVVNTAEAETVRRLFDLYDRHGRLCLVEREAARQGLRSKHHHFRSGRIQGGNAFSRGQIHKILTNPVYLGQIRHKDQIWPGLHPAVIDQGLWDRVQARLQSAGARPRGRSVALGAAKAPALLIGKFRDETGDRLTPTHTIRRGRRLTYYVSNRLISGGPDPTGWRLPAPTFDRLIAKSIADHLDGASKAHRLLVRPDLRSAEAITKAAQEVVQHLRQGEVKLIRSLLLAGKIAAGRVDLSLDPTQLAVSLGVPANDIAPDLATLSVPFQLRRRGVEAKLVIGEPAPTPDPVLLRALTDAHHWARDLRAGKAMAETAGTAGHHDALIRTRTQLAFLSPRIQTAIRDGTQPVDLTLERIIRNPMPLTWADQERLYRL
ncbi:MAG: recombinase family protein, partial [Albidovulum sp.]